MVLILDDVKTVSAQYYRGCECNKDVVYLQSLLREVCQVQEQEKGFLLPIITAAKAGRINEYLITADQVKEIFQDLWLRARACVSKNEDVAAAAAAASVSVSASTPVANSTDDSTSSVTAMQIEDVPAVTVKPSVKACLEASFEFPPAFDRWIELMNGHPDSIQRCLFRLGRVSIQGSAMWQADTFIKGMADLQTGNSSEFEKWLEELSIIEKLKKEDERYLQAGTEGLADLSKRLRRTEAAEDDTEPRYHADQLLASLAFS